MMVTPLSRRRRTSAHISLRSSTSTPAVGSSRNKMRGSWLRALSHEPRILFLDEPTAGVDVELRKEMWALVRRLRESGVTIILTTHYIAEAEDMAMSSASAM